MDKINLQIIRESFGRVVYSHKTHEKEGEIQIKMASNIKKINTIILTIGSTTLIGNMVSDVSWLLFLGSLLTTIGLFLAVFELSFNPEEKAYKHKQTANQLWQIREKYSCLIADIMNEKISGSELLAKRDNLLKELDMVYKNSLPTSSEAYNNASEALKSREEFTFSNKEINKFLPKDLWLED